MNPIKLFKKPIRKVKKAILRYWYVFVMLVVLQALFLVLVGMSTFNFQGQMIGDYGEMVAILGEGNYNETVIAQGEEVLDYKSFLSLYDSFISSFNKWLLSLGGLFLFFCGLSFALANLMLKKEKLKEVPLMWLKFIVVSLVFIIPVYFISKWTIFAFSAEIFKGVVYGLSLFYLICLYFMLSFFAFLNLSFKEIVKRTIKATVFKAHYTIPVIIVLFLITAVPLFLLYLATMNYWAFGWLIFFSLLLVIIWAKVELYLVALINFVSEL